MAEPEWRMRGPGRCPLCNRDLAESDEHTHFLHPSPPLDEAEVIARHVAALNPWAGVVMAELDRVREELAVRNAELDEHNAILEAARAVADSWSPHSMEEVAMDLVEALVREVRR